MRSELFVVATPGLEAFVARELAALHLHGTVEVGGVTLEGTLDDVRRLNRELRTASRVLWRAASFRATTFGALRHGTAEVAWDRFLRPQQPVALRVTCRKSRLHHSGAVAERVVGGIADRLGAEPPVVKASEDPEATAPQAILVRVDNDVVTLSVDTSGALLHRRGYRQETAKAPLRETLAAAMLMASGWDGGAPLVDPCCGSGTILCEAGLLGQRVPAGGQREFAWQRWPGVGAPRKDDKAVLSSAPLLFGADRDAGAIRAAEGNARRAGVVVTLAQADALRLLPPVAGPGFIVTNPPWGVRVDAEKSLPAFYARLGDQWARHWPGWTVCLLTTPQLANACGIAWSAVHPVVHGGTRVQICTGRP